MTKEEFRDKYQAYNRIELKPKKNLKEAKIGSYTLPIKDTKYRAVVEDNTIFIYAKGCHSRGYRARNDDEVLNQFDIIERDYGKEWKRRVIKVKNKLEVSGLWPEIYEKFCNLSKMDYNDRKEILAIYWSDEFSHVKSTILGVTDSNRSTREFFGKYFEKYPYLFYTNKEGYLYIDTDYLFEMSEARLKSMYFGKYYNSIYKKDIADALKNKTKLNRKAYPNYDISFEYDPEKNKAWYSEEYKNCGNGHYYIAIDASTALFLEND